MRNSSRMRCSTLKTALSAGSRSPKLLPVVSGLYGARTVSATAAATHARSTTQRIEVTVKRYPLPRPAATPETARRTEDRFACCTGPPN